MKQVLTSLPILAIGLFAAAPVAMAQTSMTYKDSNPSSYSLSLGNYYSFNLGYSHTYLGLNMRPNGNGWTLGTDGANNGGSLVVGGIGGGLSFLALPTANASSVQTFTDAQVMNYVRMRINPNGLIDIPGQLHLGTQYPLSPNNDYKLAVDGKVVAKSVYVTNPNQWADFVFEPGYKLMTLPTLESYLQKNKHLPYIPSAKEVEANGYNMAEMDAKLLRTVEELALQVIELNKQLEQLKAERQQGSK